jgi:histidinol-phosphate aminotransferase
MTQRMHGGPDVLGVPRFDFSTNSNACGPCPSAQAALREADASHYPDPSYTDLRHQLAEFHAVDLSRILLAGSASEFIFRITAAVAQQGGQRNELPRVFLPQHSYGDYAQAAQAWGLAEATTADAAQLVWACEPASPLGIAHAPWPGQLSATLVLDRAYEPLRLTGACSLTSTQLAQVWQLWTPNKALGLTGVRAAYAIAPLGAEGKVAALERLCPSWPMGAHGVALLQAWVLPEVQAWLAASLLTLQAWKDRQITLLERLGWQCLPSDANFFCARPALGCDLTQLRAEGIKLRDTTSFGLPGHVRLGVLPPDAQEALLTALIGANIDACN